MSEALSKEQFVELLRPLAEALRQVDVDAADASAQAEAASPFGGEQVAAIRAAATAHVDSDWLLPKEAGGVGANWAWSVALNDFDLDGIIDVFCTNGFVTGDQAFDT